MVDPVQRRVQNVFWFYRVLQESTKTVIKNPELYRDLGFLLFIKIFDLIYPALFILEYPATLTALSGTTV